MGRAIEDTEMERQNWHWRNTMRPVRFFALDARAAIPYFVLLVYFRPVSLFLTTLLTLIFVFLERRGLTFPAALRAFRTWFVGRNRPGWMFYRHRKPRDYV
jgi:intracellular multiplication protein IcmT